MRTNVAVLSVRPTAAALPWSPVLCVSLVAVLAAAAVSALSDRPAALATLGGAALASASVASLHDPAGRLLASVPVPALDRRLLRIGLVALVGVPVLAVLGELSPAPGGAWAPTAALLLTGLALATWLPGEHAVLVAAAIPTAWAGATQVLGDAAGALDVWATRPWLLAAVAGTAVVVGRHR